MSLPLFDRIVDVRVGLPAGPGKNLPGVATSWRDLRVSFEIKRSAQREPNNAAITIYNPDAAAAGLMQSTGQFVSLSAGYFPSASLLFMGNIAKGGLNVERQGPDMVVTIEAGDGEFMFQETPFNWAFEAGTPNSLILGTLLTQMGTALGPGAPALPPYVYPHEVVFFGPARNALDDLCADVDADWSIQDGLVVLSVKDSPTMETAVLLTPDTGLIGAPTRTDDGLQVVCLLNPELRPRRVFSLVSERFVGFYQCVNVTHRGDTESTEWYTEVEAKQVGA